MLAEKKHNTKRERVIEEATKILYTKGIESSVEYSASQGFPELAALTAWRKGIGYAIRTLINERCYFDAAEIAYDEFGLERAVKILLNGGDGRGAAKFALEKGGPRMAYEIYVTMGLSLEAEKLSKIYNFPSFKKNKLEGHSKDNAYRGIF